MKRYFRMTTLGKLNLCIVGGAGRRGLNFKWLADASGSARVHAICDVNKDALQAVMSTYGDIELFTNYDEMLQKSDLDAIIISSPMDTHASMAIKALKLGINVLIEVTAGVSVEECKELVKTWSESNAIYMMAENYIYMKPNMLITELMKKGLFGQVYYAEGEYLYSIKSLYDTTKWRDVGKLG